MQFQMLPIVSPSFQNLEHLSLSLTHADIVNYQGKSLKPIVAPRLRSLSLKITAFQARLIGSEVRKIVDVIFGGMVGPCLIRI